MTPAVTFHSIARCVAVRSSLGAFGIGIISLA